MTKLKKFQFVQVSNILPENKTKGFLGIVEERDKDDYSIYQIEDGKIINSISWYHRSSLTLARVQDRNLALKMIEEYEDKFNED